MTDEAKATLSDICMKYRGKTGLTQIQLAAKVGISTRTIHDIETASYRSNLKRSTIYKVLYAIGGDELADSWKY